MNKNRRYHAFKTQVTKSVGQDGLLDGEFVALASVFDNVDSYGEVMRKGAFTESLAEFAAAGNPVPVIWQHDWQDPFSHIGVAVEIEETDAGLMYKGLLDVNEAKAAKVYSLMKGRRIVQQSFGYDVLEAGWIKMDGIDVYEITKVKLFEVGPCLVGVNQDTQLLGIKSGDGASIRPAPGTESASGQDETPATSDTPEPSAAKGEASSVKSETPVSQGLSPASIRMLAELEIEPQEGAN